LENTHAMELLSSTDFCDLCVLCVRLFRQPALVQSQYFF
jgi:hypothetical protein